MQRRSVIASMLATTFLATTALAATSGTAAAQVYPSQPIRVIVPPTRPMPRFSTSTSAEVRRHRSPTR